MAFALSVTLFVYFWGVGYAVVAILHTQRDLVRNALMAPAVGVAVTIYSTYVLSRLGLPVGKFAHFLAVGTIILAAAAWLWARPLLPARHLLPYLPIALLAFVATGWPLLNHGFTWLGDINPDMTNYVLDAHRLVDQAYIQSPDPAVWRNQSDWAAYYVTFPILGFRPGAQLLLAWAITITGMNGLMVYMPLLVALHVALIAVATALIGVPHRYARLLAAILMSSSAMLTLGVVLQLVAQVLGLILLALSCILCLSPFYRLNRRVLWRFIALAAVVMTTFVLSYPEMLGFFGLAFLIYHGLAAIDIRRFVVPASKAIIAIAVIASVPIAADAFSLVTFLLQQIQVGGTTMRLPELFPYFLIPSGLGAMWGLNEYVAGESVWLSASIVCGAVLGVLAVASTCWLSWRREPAAAVGVVMIAVAPVLFLTDNGFGALKLAMYVQPFLLSTMALATCLTLRGSR
jgi:hypothetical protein